MQKLIGSEIWVFLKKDVLSVFGDVNGVLVDMDTDSIYVRRVDKTFAIPRENVAYCTTNEFKASENRIMLEEQPYTEPLPEFSPEPETTVIDKLKVYINKELVASIPIPPTFQVYKWSDKILRVIMGNPDVSSALAGKIQKEIEYSPGEVYISVEQITPPSQMPEQLEQQSQNTFSIGGSPTTDYLSPMQMALRLKKVAGEGNKNNDKAGM